MNGYEKRMLEASIKEYEDINDNYTKFQRRLRLDGHTAKMGMNGLAVYMILLDHRNNTTGLCCPSYETIAEELGVAKSTIQLAIKKLVELGYIIKVSGADKKAKRNTQGQIKNENNQYIIVPLNYVDKHSAIEEEIMAPEQEAAATIKVTETVKVETKQSKSKVTEEELQDATEEFSFLEPEYQDKMIKVIKAYGYKPGFSEQIKEYVGMYDQLGRKFELTDSIRDEYWLRHLE